MICPFCSLLCDAENLDTVQCARRSASLVQIASHRLGQSGDVEAKRRFATESLQRAKRVLVTGRITSVQTARAVVAFAATHNATLDCADSGHAFKNILAIQRSGLNSVSIAEARDHSDFMIVIGNDALLQAVPRMPFSLRNSRKQRQVVMLLGEYGNESVVAWRSAGFETWAVHCELKETAKALCHWSHWSDQVSKSGSELGETLKKSSSTPLLDAMALAHYTTVLWSAENLDFAQADLWVETLLQWISTRNDTKRCAGLPWSSSDGTFVQVCTWLTGFPGRLSFREGQPHYDPNRFAYEQWIQNESTGNARDSIVVLIDESSIGEQLLKPFLPGVLDRNMVIELTPNSELFPTAIAGFDGSADMFRADQTLLAHVSPKEHRPSIRQPAAYWLKGLSQS